MDNYFYRPANGFLEAAAGTTPKGEYITSQKESEWDKAHELLRESPHIGYIEPDLEKQNPEAEAKKAFLEGGPALNDDEYDPAWPFPRNGSKPDKKFWHIESEFSQLKDAWETVGDDAPTIRIAHFDTGYDPEHKTCPPNIENNGLQRNYVEGNNSAIDIGSDGWLNQKYHGIGTISILGGNTMNIPGYNHDGYLGIHKNIRILPIRMSRSVILWKNKAFVDALEHIIKLYDNPATRCHIVTMSMGGMPSRAWADAVNRAYDKGIFIVTAAGNNFGRVTPSTLVYPARFPRVTAACGVTNDYSPYRLEGVHLKAMQGNFGPRKAMRKAIAAFTPNVAWAVKNDNIPVSINGAGTSSATPQIAAAAALYYQKYYDELSVMEGWKRIEAIRGAMFLKADKHTGGNGDTQLHFGNGILKAKDMLEVKPSEVALEKEGEVKVRWPFLKLITGTNLLEAETEMYEVEILQLIAKTNALQQLLDREEKEFDELTDGEQRKFYSIILSSEDASDSLKKMIVSQELN